MGPTLGSYYTKRGKCVSEEKSWELHTRYEGGLDADMDVQGMSFKDREPEYITPHGRSTAPPDEVELKAGGPRFS